jgi:hypothetical protein
MAEVSTEVVKRFTGEIGQGSGSGNHSANAQFTRPDGACVRRPHGCRTADFEATALLNAASIVNRSRAEKENTS